MKITDRKLFTDTINKLMDDTGFYIEVMDVNKPTEGILTGIVIRQRGVTNGMCPTIYAEWYDTMEELIDGMLYAISCKPPVPFDTEEVTSVDFIKANVRGEAHKKGSVSVGENLYRIRGDKVILYRVIINEEASYLLSKGLAEHIGLSEPDLFAAVCRNGYVA